MKNSFVLLFIFCSVFSYSQTWTVQDNDNRRDVEYTVITKEQYQRLLRQYEASNEFCIMEYTDILEMPKSVKVISGTIPSFNGYYYLMAKIKPQLDKFTTEEKKALGLFNMTNGLLYGHSDTGLMSIIFVNGVGFFGFLIPGAVDVNSDDYKKKYNLFSGFVNGE